MIAGAWGRSDDRARPLGDILRALMRRKRFEQKSKYGSLVDAWAELVGDEVAARTRICAFDEGQLLVEVNSSALLHELNGFMKQQILASLQAGDAGRDVAEIRFRLTNGAKIEQ